MTPPYVHFELELTQPLQKDSGSSSPGAIFFLVVTLWDGAYDYDYNNYNNYNDNRDSDLD